MRAHADKERRTWNRGGAGATTRPHAISGSGTVEAAIRSIISPLLQLARAPRGTDSDPSPAAASIRPEERWCWPALLSAARRLRSRAAPVDALGCIFVRKSLVVGKWILLHTTHSLVHWCCVRPSQDRASNPGGLMYGWPGFSTSQRRCNCLPQ